MRCWRNTGLAAALLIVFFLSLYCVQRSKQIRNRPEAPGEAQFIGSNTCKECHKKEFDEWSGSHHERAMDTATDRSVLGDFDNALFTRQGVTSRFYSENGNYFVHTAGPDGKMADFQISHTFGWYPLQQYLVPFAGGRLQCLPIAWDVREKKWFHLYPDLELDPAEWIYWTNQGQNWNSMCADCHSTRLQKNYDPDTDSYDSRWAEISVGCEACHGAGSIHVAWGRLPRAARDATGNGLPVQTAGMTNRQQVELCAPCHSRRSMLADYVHKQQDLLDTETPRLLEEDLYYPDGQIRDEVYVYGSFVQSKMYANGVRCSDCHNVHTLTQHQEGNALCLRCHQSRLYDTGEHHFHKKADETGEPIRDQEGMIVYQVGSGSQCIECHMPGRSYMVNDYRPDHSIRVPRPDLSIALGTPNSCTRCHVDKNNEWAAEYTGKWYGSKIKYHFGTTFAAARAGEPAAGDELIRIVSDPLTTPLIRATALSLLGRFSGERERSVFEQALLSDESLIRRTALMQLGVHTPDRWMNLVGPLLDDPIKGVRIEAARALTAVPADQLDQRWRQSFDKALDEFRETTLYSADFAASRLNLGTLYTYQNQLDKAEEEFKKAISIDPGFISARTNLAVLYNRKGKNDLAEEQLRKALEADRARPDVHYSLGLLLSEQKRYEEAVHHLRLAATGLPDTARVHSNLGRLLVFLGHDAEAEAALQRAVDIEPASMPYLQEIVQFYLSRGKLEQAEELARRISSLSPDNPFGRQLLQYISELKK